MRKTPYILTFFALFIPAVLQVLNWANSSKLTNPVVLWVKGHFSSTLVWIAVASFVVSASKELPGLVGFPRRCTQRALDQFVKENCSSSSKHHRLTLFKQASGFRAFTTGAFRLLRDWGGTREKWAALWGISWVHSYLYVYARASEARRQLSSAAFQISDDPDQCEGVAGQTWEQGFCIATDLPHVTQDMLRKAPVDLATLPMDDPVRLYAEKTFTRSAKQLRAIVHPARHFMGAVVRVNGKPWGVLLLDSESTKRPFPDPGKKKDGGPFGRQFKSCAAMLSHYLT